MPVYNPRNLFAQNRKSHCRLNHQSYNLPSLYIALENFQPYGIGQKINVLYCTLIVLAVPWGQCNSVNVPFIVTIKPVLETGGKMLRQDANIPFPPLCHITTITVEDINIKEDIFTQFKDPELPIQRSFNAREFTIIQALFYTEETKQKAKINVVIKM